MGFLAGPPFTTALQHYSNGSRVAVQGIDYPATPSGFRAGGDEMGALAMAVMANTTLEQCPSTKMVLSGYSQGAQVVRKALAMMMGNSSNDNPVGINSIVLFGDPNNGTAIPNIPAERTRTFCHMGDDICAGGSQVLAPHFNYSSDAPAAAMFVMQRTGLGLASGDAEREGMGDIPMMMPEGSKRTGKEESPADGLVASEPGGKQVVMDLASMQDDDDGDGEDGKGGGMSGLMSALRGLG
ncbi:cutinase-domain-containing protein [Pseudomassariella vexata]|uniref:cutinase n=1 Tax=Pseudomassariella vexata TaxID=1141098 RepID=A0A1Y2DUI3_9PEZI|nr:cutinase-domain-containing protein [Pseudomassariella vexata]ORY62943.1 cutinase-domain-containing protein [Pseudomassariella vexata]